MIYRILALLLIALPCSAQTWSTWNGKTVGSSTGNVSSMDGKTIGTSTGNYNTWNNLAVASSGAASWSYIQTANRDCTAGSTCTAAIDAPTTANSVIVFAVYTSASNSITSVSLSGCSGGAGTWTGGSGSSYAAFNSSSAGMAWIFNLANSGGCTGFTVNLTTAEPGAWGAALDEFSRGSGTPALDALASANLNTTSCTTCTGSSFTSLSGSSDLIVQIANTGSSTSSPSSPYAWDTGSVMAYALNSTATAAPTWTQSSGGFQTFGVAFK